jgi:hypothetical protein
MACAPPSWLRCPHTDIPFSVLPLGTDVPARDEHVPFGVSVGFLRDSQEALGRQRRNIATEKLFEDVFKPATLTQCCAFLDTLRGRTDSSGRQVVGRATVFVSHAWQYRANDVLDTLLEYASDCACPGSQYFWLDVFCQNQHADSQDQPLEWRYGAVKDRIAAIGTVLLVMTPWDAPIPLKRAWCLWEIYCALEPEQQSKAQLIVRLPASQRADFQEGITDDSSSVLKALAAIDAEQAQAHSLQDREYILGAMRSRVGFADLNSAVSGRMRDCYVATAAALAEESRDAQALDGLGLVLVDLGELDKALELYHRSLNIKVVTLCDSHLGIAATCKCIASVHDSRGRFEEALGYYQRALDIGLAALGDKHYNIAVTYHNMTRAYNSQGQFDKALEFYQKD